MFPSRRLIFTVLPVQRGDVKDSQRGDRSGTNSASCSTWCHGFGFMTPNPCLYLRPLVHHFHRAGARCL